jgi:hypothetical protein
VNRRVLAGVAALAIAATVTTAAQFQRGVPRGTRLATERDYDGRFHFCRLVYQGNRNGGSWTTDFPNADINMSIRLAELTRVNVSFANGQPNHLLVSAADPSLYQCPMVIMTAPGSVVFSSEEVAALRDYLAKGGFLWADDFWGTDQWEQWESELRKVLPAGEHPIVDVPPDHPMLHAQFVVTEIPQIPNIGYFRRSGGDTSERGSDSAVPTARIITDDEGHVMVLMTHNTDISDSREREGDDPSYFYAFSPRGYALGINVFLYALTH